MAPARMTTFDHSYIARGLVVPDEGARTLDDAGGRGER